MLNRSQVAVMNIQYKYFPVATFLDDAVKNNVNNIELWGASPHCYIEDMTYKRITNLRHQIENRKLKLICYTPEQCVYPINIASETREERFRSIKYFEDSIRLASELGSDKMLVTSGWGYFDGSNLENAWEYSRQGLFELAEMASHYGVKLALEVLRKDESNLVNDLGSLCKMLDAVNHKNLGGMIDTIPMALAGESPKDYLEKLGDRLVHIHFIDGAPRGHLAWGDGILSMEQYLSELSAYDYQNYLSLEITDSRYFVDPSESVRQSIEKLYNVMD
ncbi:TIM barrel protein [Oscillospiraceae bacterium PP1C4]